jgi:transposase-like protein
LALNVVKVSFSYNVPEELDTGLRKDNEPDTVRIRMKGRDQDMSKRKFTAEFKTKLVLELLSGEREIGEMALEHQINPNQLRTWRAQFLSKASTLFDDVKVKKEAERKAEEAEAERASMLKTIGELTLERDFLMRQAHERNKGVYLRRG